VLDLRGNVDSRLRRLKEGRFEAIVLAMAGLLRLGLEGEVTEAMEPEVLLPAPGQGAIALQCREDDRATREAVAPLHHEPTARAVSAERSFLAALEAGCNVPLGALAVEEGDGLRLRTFVARPDGREMLREEAFGQDPVELGRSVAATLLDRGAASLLREEPAP
jgi:hydroxymethylbilane synthase